MLWIIKKYAPHRAVGVNVIRELKRLIYITRASKGIIVTTSGFTKEAMKLNNKNQFIISYIDNEMLEKEFLNPKSDENISDELPF